MSDLKKYKEKQLLNNEFKHEYERTRTEYELFRSLINLRIEQSLTQKELSELSGIRQSNISRIENGTVSPTIATLDALAKGLGKRLVIDFK